MTDNFYKSEIDRELLLNIEIQKQNLKVLPEKFKAQKKVVSPVTQQMIDDYKKQFRDLYKRKDSKGTEAFYKFLIPESYPYLEEVDSTQLETVLDEAGIRTVNNIIERKINEYKNYNDDIVKNLKIIEDYKKEINDLSALLSAGQIKIEKKKKKKNSVIYQKLTEDEKDDIKADLILFNQGILGKDVENFNIKTNQNNLQTEIDTLYKELINNDENIIKNEKYRFTIEQNNRKKLDEFAETIKRMNDGQIDLTRGQDESEDDYLRRLTELALIEEDPTRAILFNTNEFKKNLKTIINSEWKIENIIKSIDPETMFLINKTFAFFKKEFIKVYGLNNKLLEIDEYLSLINSYADQNKLTITTKTASDETDNDQNKLTITTKTASDETDNEKNNVDYPPKDGLIKPMFISAFPEDDEFFDAQKNLNLSSSELPDPQDQALEPLLDNNNEDKYENNLIGSNNSDTLVIYNKKTTGFLYLKLSPPKKGSGTTQIEYSYAKNKDYKIFNKDTIDPNFSNFKSMQARIRGLLGYIFDDTNLNKFISNIRLFLRINTKKQLTITNFSNYIQHLIENPPNTDEEFSEIELERLGSGLRKSKKSKRKKIIPQKGASVKQVDKFVEFGNLILLLRKLYDTNVLSIKDKTGINIPGIPNQKVNDNFVNLILKIVNNEDVNLKDIDDLNQKDSILFTVLMNKAGLKKKYQINNVRTLEALSKRLELLEGEFEAGNDNDLMIKELYEIVFKLAYLGAITLSNAKKHYKQTIQLLKKN